MKGKAEYATLKESLANVIQDVNNLIDKGYILVDGKKINLEFYLEGDYKVRYHRKAVTLEYISKESAENKESVENNYSLRINAGLYYTYSSLVRF